MINQQDFLGREEIIELLNKRVSGLSEGYRQNIALIGPKLIGKTSIILNFFQGIDKSKYIILYVDFNATQFSHFVYKFIASLLYNFSQDNEDVNSKNILNLTERAKPFIPKTIDFLSKVKADLDKRKFQSAYLKILDTVELIQNETGKPVIFVVDEFHRLDKIKIKNIFSELGKKIMVQKKVMYILISSSESKAKNILSEKLSLLFGNFETVEIGPLDYRESLFFIKKQLKGIDLSGKAENFIIAFSEGNPFYLDIICSEIQNAYLKTSQIPYDSLQLISEAYKNLLFEQHGILSQHFANFLMRIAHKYSGTKLISILMIIANNHTRLKDIIKLMRSTSKDTRQKLEKLYSAGIIFKSGAFYQFTDKIFPFWLKFVYQKRITDLGWDIAKKEKEFSEELLSYISNIEAIRKRSIKERFVELFYSFNNEMVQIEDKKLKLPNFKDIKVIYSEGDKFSLLARGENTSWLIHINKAFIEENDASDFIKRCKGLPCKLNKKIIIDLNGMDINSRLLAKENKALIWNTAGVNLLFDIACKSRIISNEDISIG